LGIQKKTTLSGNFPLKHRKLLNGGGRYFGELPVYHDVYIDLPDVLILLSNMVAIEA